MRGRLIISITSTILELAAIFAITVWVLPMTGILIPFWLLFILMGLWAAYSIFTHKMGTRALLMKKPTGFTDMVGSRGKTIVSLNPEGMVRIQGETWMAVADAEAISEGCKVIVIAQRRLRLVVRRCAESDIADPKH